MPFRLRQKKIKNTAAAPPNAIVSSAGAAFSILDNAAHDTVLSDFSLSGGAPSGQGVWSLTNSPWSKLYFAGTTGPGATIIGNVATVRLYDLDGLAAGDQGAKTATISYVDRIGGPAVTFDIAITVVATAVNLPPTSIISSQGTALQIPDNAANNAVITTVSLGGGIPLGTGTWSFTGTPWAKVDFNTSATTATGLTANITINDASNLDATDQGTKSFTIQYTGEQGMTPISATIGATVYDSTAGAVVRTLTIQNDSGSTVSNARIEVGLPLGPNKWAHTTSSHAVCTLGGGIGDIQANLTARSKGWSENNTTRWGALNFVVPSLPAGATTVTVKRVTGAESASPGDAARLALLSTLKVELTGLLRKVNRTDVGTPMAGTWTALWSDAAAVVRIRRTGAACSAWECCIPFTDGTSTHKSLVGRIVATVWSDNTVHVKAQVCNSRGDGDIDIAGAGISSYPFIKHSTWGYTATLSQGSLVLGAHTINGQIANSHHWVGEEGTMARGFAVRSGALVSDQAQVWVKHNPAELMATQMVPPFQSGTYLYDWSRNGATSTVTGYHAGGAAESGTAHWGKGYGAAGSVDRDHHFLCPNPFADWIINPVNELQKARLCVSNMAVGSIPCHVTDPVKFGPVYVMNQAAYTKPTGYSSNDYKELSYGFGSDFSCPVLTKSILAPISSVEDGFKDQNGPFDNCHWGAQSCWTYLLFGQVWQQIVFEDEIVMSVVGQNYVYKTYTVGATVKKWYSAVLIYTQERGHAWMVRQYMFARALNAVDGPYYQYFQDLVENWLDASVDVYNNLGRQWNVTQSLWPPEAKVLYIPKNWVASQLFVTTWMGAYGAISVAMLRRMGAVSKLTWLDHWLKYIVGLGTQRGFFDGYWHTNRIGSGSGYTASQLHQTWDVVKVSHGSGVPASLQTNYADPAWSLITDAAAVAAQNVYWRFQVLGGAADWAVWMTLPALRLAKVVGYTGAAAAMTVQEGIMAASPANPGWRRGDDQYPSYRIDGNATHVADV